MPCYYVVIRSTHLRDGQLRSVKGVFRGPIGASGARGTVETGSSLYCELCDKQYERQQQYDNHTSSYDHHHRQRLKELKQREFYRLLGSRRQRRDPEQWPRRQRQERGPAQGVAGSGPMFRSTTVALNASEEEDPDVFTNCKAVTSCCSSSVECSLTDTTAIASSRLQTVTKAPEGRDHVSRTVSAASDAPDDGDTTSTPHTPWRETQARPVSFSLPKKNCVLRHQAAAVFLQTPTPKETVTHTPPTMDHVDLHSSVVTDPINNAYEPTRKEQNNFPDDTKTQTFSQRPKEPFCRVLSRDDSTVLLWPSEMVSYTCSAPSVSFSVNPLLHNFRPENTTKEVERRNESGELGRRELIVIKQAEQEQRQADAQRGGLLSPHERKQEHGGGQPPVQVVGHCVSSKCEENAVKFPLYSEFKKHREKKRRHKRRTRARRTDGVKKKELKLKSLTMSNISSLKKEAKRKNLLNAKRMRKDHTVSNKLKGAELLSHLPVSHFNNECEELCAQVNSQDSHHLPLPSVSKRSRGFRERPSGGAACNAAISHVPVFDIETPCCPAITPCPAQSGTKLWEARAATRPGENSVIPQTVTTGQGLSGKRTFDEVLNLDSMWDQAQNVPVEPPTADHAPHPPHFTPADLQCEQVTGRQKCSNSRDTSPMMETPPVKRKNTEKYLEKCLNFMYIHSDLDIQEETKGVIHTSAQMITTIGRTKSNTGSCFLSQRSPSKEVKQSRTTTYSYSHSTGEDTPLDRAMDKSSTKRCPHNECQDAQDKHNRCSRNVTTEKANTCQIEPTQHSVTTVSTTVTDLIPGDAHSCQCDFTHHFTNCNYSERDAGVVVLISTHPDQRGKEVQKKQVQQRRRTATRGGDWACFPRPLYLQHLQPLISPIPTPLIRPIPTPLIRPIPTPLIRPIPTHLSPPLLPPLFYTSTPVPLLDRPPHPLTPFSLQSGGPSLYRPPLPQLPPLHYVFHLLE